MKQRSLLSVFLGISLLVVLACGDDEPETVSVSLALDWYPNSNHAGIYEAVRQGYFDEEGLDVNIYTPSDPVYDSADRRSRQRRVRHQLPARSPPGTERRHPSCRCHGHCSTPSQLDHDFNRLRVKEARRPARQEDRPPGHPFERGDAGDDAQL